MQVQLLQRDKETGILSFLIKGTDSAFVNTLRRMIIEEVPTLAIENVEFRDNSSALYDEVIAHRLGLIPIKTDLKSYNLPSECSCKGKGCAKCTLKMTLSSKSAGHVYAKDFKSKDPKCVPAFPDIPITKLMKGQKIEIEATACLGQGNEHAKWSPGLVHYRGYPILKVKANELNAAVKSKIMEASNQCQGIIQEKDGKINITDVNQWKESYEQICEENDITVSVSDSDFIVTIESWGQLDPRDMVKEAISRLQKKTDSFIKLLK